MTPPTTKTILCVDDDADDREMVCEAIAHINPAYNVVHAEDGKKAHEYLLKAKTKNEFPCLVILDINMPGMDGKETLAHIKKDDKLRNIPVVLFSTSDSEVDKRFCAKYDVELVTKPSKMQTIAVEIKRLLRYCEKETA